MIGLKISAYPVQWAGIDSNQVSIVIWLMDSASAISSSPKIF